MSISSTAAAAGDTTTAPTTAPTLDGRGKRLIADLNPRKRRPAIRKALAALGRWRRRQARKEHPDGYFYNMQWYPLGVENVDNFTSWIREPSRAWPYSYLLAARTLEHCEALERADHRVVLALKRGGFSGEEAAAAVTWK